MGDRRWRIGGIIPAYAGNTILLTEGCATLSGSSPHTRGTPRWRIWTHVRVQDHPRIRGEHQPVRPRPAPVLRIIPAYAGNTRAVVHPPTALVGSSPHTRGTPARTPRACMSSRDHPRIRGEHFKLAVAIQQREGIIPAYAGNTWWLVPAPFTNWGSSPHTRGTHNSHGSGPPVPKDHPRIRGEHSSARRSNRARPRIIPAYAGNTIGRSRTSLTRRGSSPHTRGAPLQGGAHNRGRGDHPRIRGEHRRDEGGADARRGIIPAYAGNTHSVLYIAVPPPGSSPHTRGTLPQLQSACMPTRDHPRIRGEHSHMRATSPPPPADHPRIRGEH